MHNNFKNGDIVENTRLHDDNIGMLIEPEREFSEYWKVLDSRGDLVVWFEHNIKKLGANSDGAKAINRNNMV